MKRLSRNVAVEFANNSRNSELKARGDHGFFLKCNFSVSPSVGTDSVPPLLLAGLQGNCNDQNKRHNQKQNAENQFHFSILQINLYDADAAR